MAHVASLFSQLLRHFPRTEFASLVKEHRAERHAKGFTCWDQFVSMLFCHLARADSLREICGGLSCCLGKLAHLGMGKAPKRSTLSYANEHRPAVLYESLFWAALDRFRGQGSLGARKARFRFKNKPLSLDSTTVSLCLSLFPWADFRRAKGGVKVHVMLDHDDYMPSFVIMTEARRHDVKAARTINLPPGSIVAMDRAYNDFHLFAKWTAASVFFVTRMKENTVYEVVEERDLPKKRSILRDQIIRLSGAEADAKCPHLMRRIVVWDAEREREIVLLTNHLGFGATTIALRIQIWTALIAMLLLKWLHHLSKAGWSLSNLAAMLRMNLFTYRDLETWIDDPFDTPPEVPGHAQLTFSLPGLGQPTIPAKGGTSTQNPALTPAYAF
jgi:hypothetical protein